MKKILSILVVFAMVATALPALAGETIFNSEDFPTTVTVVRDTNPGPGGNGGGGGTPCPFVIELGTSVPVSGTTDHFADNHYVWILEDDDHTADLTQINPNPGSYVCRTVWAVVDDDMGLDNIRQVLFQVQYPDIEPFCGCSKPKVEFTRESSTGTIENAIDDAYDANLISKNDKDALYYNLFAQGNWSIWKATLCLDYCEPAGIWTLFVWGEDYSNNYDNVVEIDFEYVAVAVMQTDFSSINYGVVAPGVTKRIEGDEDMGTSNRPTLKNIGNTRLTLQIKSDEMLMSGEQNGITQFDYQFKDEEANYEVEDGWVQISPIFCLCNTEKLDLSIHPGRLLPQGTYTGMLYLHIEEHPFDECCIGP